MGPALQGSPASELVLVASRDFAKAQAQATVLGCQAAPSYEALVSSPQIDAVYIPLPIGLHKEWCLKAIAQGKHVICEKSLAPDLPSVLEVTEAARRANVLVVENFMCLFHSQHQEVLRALRERRLGSVKLFTGRFGFPRPVPGNIRLAPELAGGALNDAGAYLVKMSRFILGAEPEALEFAQLSMGPSGVDEFGHLVFRFPGGVLASLTFGFGLDYQNAYEIWGEAGSIRLDRAYSIPPTLTPPGTLKQNDVASPLSLQPDNHFEHLISDFCRQVRALRSFDKSLAELERQARWMQEVRKKATSFGH